MRSVERRVSRGLKWLSIVVGTSVALLAPRQAHADTEIRLEASSLLGTTTPERAGWRSMLVRLHNPGSSAAQGTLELSTRLPWARTDETLSTELPFALAPGTSARVEAPTRGFGGGQGAVRVRARDSQGRLLAEATVNPQPPADALVLHLSSPSRIAPVLRDLTFASQRGPVYTGRTRSCSIGVSGAPVDSQSGDVLLPTRAAGYSEATLVLGVARDFARLGDAERTALLAWVLAGGALALSLDRPEDLADTTLRAVAGGTFEQAAAPADLASGTLFIVPPEEGAEPNTTGMTPFRSIRLSPSAPTRNKLVGYEGANLRPTSWGAAASYGLGELHLLAFNPEDPEVAADPWARYKLADLTRHAYDREPLSVVRQSGQFPDTASVDAVRRELDPNQASRWTIVVSAVVLLFYAVLAGPLAFYMAARKGRPLRAIFQLPIWSGLTLAIIVLLGVAGKGTRGKARRLTFVETGAGVSSGAALMFRSFYAASSRDLIVRASDRAHVLDLASGAGVSRTLVVDRDGPRLVGLRTKPWQTVVVREEGFVDLSGGISIVPVGAEMVVKNRAARDLLGVVVKPPRADARYFTRIRDGESVPISSGKLVGAVGASTGATATAIPLAAYTFMPSVEADFPGLGKAWAAIEPALTGSSEWWPPDVPVLIAALDGGQGKLSDSGLQVDYDRVLVRVVGTGGLP